ncbi:MAG: hypothetical protein ABIT83_00045 [Massilia sp.]
MKPSLQLKIAALLGYVLLCTMLVTGQRDDGSADEAGARAGVGLDAGLP